MLKKLFFLIQTFLNIFLQQKASKDLCSSLHNNQYHQLYEQYLTYRGKLIKLFHPRIRFQFRVLPIYYFRADPYLDSSFCCFCFHFFLLSDQKICQKKFETMYFIAREGNQQQPAACRASIRTYECWFNPKQPQRLTVFIARWSHQICISVSANVRDTLSILNSKRRRGDKMTFSQLIHTHWYWKNHPVDGGSQTWGHQFGFNFSTKKTTIFVFFH